MEKLKGSREKELESLLAQWYRKEIMKELYPELCEETEKILGIEKPKRY